jgi:hypothetical protein
MFSSYTGDAGMNYSAGKRLRFWTLKRLPQITQNLESNVSESHLYLCGSVVSRTILAEVGWIVIEGDKGIPLEAAPPEEQIGETAAFCDSFTGAHSYESLGKIN